MFLVQKTEQNEYEFRLFIVYQNHAKMEVPGHFITESMICSGAENNQHRRLDLILAIDLTRDHKLDLILKHH